MHINMLGFQVTRAYHEQAADFSTGTDSLYCFSPVTEGIHSIIWDWCTVGQTTS